MEEHGAWHTLLRTCSLHTTRVTGTSLLCCQHFCTGEALIFFQLGVEDWLNSWENTTWAVIILAVFPAVDRFIFNSVQRGWLTGIESSCAGRKGVIYFLEFKSSLSSNTAIKWPGTAARGTWDSERQEVVGPGVLQVISKPNKTLKRKRRLSEQSLLTIAGCWLALNISVEKKS